ncbi:uncharacterized protein LOC123296783 isoform X2 [Chrysoperla carnea]|uniref:uncharacterized protein LOC123296783 isoform X2 n=1 Tax=Chrysoperla carnea TaxID=189513 RepID=UPI001D064980|nr:uncharacterized protein LOC123296783 isoform X2 [Chrysoperla carnea]
MSRPNYGPYMRPISNQPTHNRTDSGNSIGSDYEPPKYQNENGNGGYQRTASTTSNRWAKGDDANSNAENQAYQKSEMKSDAQQAIRPTSLYGTTCNRPELGLYPPDSGLTPEREPIKFDINLVGAPAEVEQLINNIKHVAESFLYHWRTFPIVLPTPVSVTQPNRDQCRSDLTCGSPHSLSRRHRGPNLRDLFVAPSFDELDAVAVDSKGEPRRLSGKQLESCRERGEFEVDSINFPGQVHRWQLSQLLQKGTERSRETLLKDLALALRFIIVTARNRICSHFFSVIHAIRALGSGLFILLDVLIGLPSLQAHNLDAKIREERCRYLVAELVCPSEYADNLDVLCDWLRREMRRAATEKISSSPNGNNRASPICIPYRYATAQGGFIDLRLMDRDLMRKALPILVTILEREARGWFLHFRERLIAELRSKKMQDHEIEQEVNEAVMREYLQRVYSSVLSHPDLQALGDSIPQLLVQQAQSVVLMHRAVEEVQKNLTITLNNVEERLADRHPVMSRVSPWLRAQLRNAQQKYAIEHQWSAHEHAIELCNSQRLHQTVYFLNRDLSFMREREPALLRELSKVRIATRTYTWATQIWCPSGWKVRRCFQGETQIIPTVLSNQPTSITTPRSDPSQPIFLVEKEQTRTTTCRWPLWRWVNYTQRTWAWSLNAMFLLGIVVPWCSPVGLRALFYIQPFMPDLELSQVNGTLFPRKSSLTPTLCSRLVSLWRHISKSRTYFETKPDTGFIGKGFTRHMNRFWNYIIKGLLGTFVIVFFFPLICIIISLCSIVVTITTFMWMPVVTLLLHIFMGLVYDFDSPAPERNRYFVVFEAIIWNILIQGLIQPCAALLVAILFCPLLSLIILTCGVVRYWFRLCWDSILFHAIIKKRGRIPASDSFVVRRIAGPGLASNYFFQIRPEQALAAFESKMELEKLAIYQRITENTILQPQKDFAQFIEGCFGPFSAQLAKTGPYRVLEKECQELIGSLHEKLERRRRDLHTGLSVAVRCKIKLSTQDLKVSIQQAALMLERFYPANIFSHMLMLNQTEEEFWDSRGLSHGDWAGLAGLLYADIFSLDFLTPLDETQTSFKLEPDSSVDLSRYTDLVHSAELGVCGPDLLGAVYAPRGNIQIHSPYLEVSAFNPRSRFTSTAGIKKNEKKNDSNTMTSLRSRKQRQNKKTKEEIEDVVWAPWKSHIPPYSPDKLIIPLPVPHPSHIAVIVYNRDSENPIPLDTDPSCLEILKRLEESHGIIHYTGIGRYRGGGDCPESSYESTVDSQSSTSESPGGDVVTSAEPATPDEPDPPTSSGGYQWTLSQWGPGARKRVPSGTVRVDLASPEDVTLDTDSNQVVFNPYGTTV